MGSARFMGLKVGLPAGSVSIIWELNKDANSQSPDLPNQQGSRGGPRCLFQQALRRFLMHFSLGITLLGTRESGVVCEQGSAITAL